jgi:hypothetical protein
MFYVANAVQESPTITEFIGAIAAAFAIGAGLFGTATWLFRHLRRHKLLKAFDKKRVTYRESMTLSATPHGRWSCYSAMGSLGPVKRYSQARLGIISTLFSSWPVGASFKGRPASSQSSSPSE